MSKLTFFDELAVVLDQVATYQEPIYVVGDFNIRIDRPDSPRNSMLGHGSRPCGVCRRSGTATLLFVPAYATRKICDHITLLPVHLRDNACKYMNCTLDERL